MSKKDLTHEEIEHTFLCKEYSFHAAEEFLEAQGTSGEAWRLRTRRLNMQYDDAEDLTQQSLYFAKRLPAQMIAHIIEMTAGPSRRSSSAKRSASARRRARRSSSVRRSLFKID